LTPRRLSLQRGMLLMVAVGTLVATFVVPRDYPGDERAYFIGLVVGVMTGAAIGIVYFMLRMWIEGRKVFPRNSEQS
jgi:hypothetical protein